MVVLVEYGEKKRCDEIPFNVAGIRGDPPLLDIGSTIVS